MGDSREVEVTVKKSLFPGIRQVLVEAEDGFQYIITPATPGVQADQLQKGQRLHCLVTRRLPRVLSAHILE